MDEMDVVYILGSGSLSENKEILYSVRSICANMLDLNNIYVIGDKPMNLPNVIHIPMTDELPEKWRNAYFKTKRACIEPDITDEFLLMNDDFFMCEPFTGADFPFYSLKGSNGGACGVNSFHVHCPIRIKKEWYKNMPFDINSSACKSPRTLYANFYRAPVSPIDDPIVTIGETSEFDEADVIGRKFFSVGDTAMLNLGFCEWLDTIYHMKSRYE